MPEPLRVAGADPGTSSLDLLILEDGAVADQIRFTPNQLRTDPAAPVNWLSERGPLALVAGPSGYGVPLIRNADLTDLHIEQMTLVRPDERGTAQGILGFTATLKAFRTAPFPVVFLPGVIHLPSVPEHRKFNRIDLGTPDKLCVAALAIAQGAAPACCVVELGSAFTACLVVHEGQIVNGIGGTSGPLGWQASGAWDGEVAYLMSPLRKGDLFHGGASELPRAQGVPAFTEAVVSAVAGLRAVTPFEQTLVSGRLFDSDLEVALPTALALGAKSLFSLAGAWVKQAAQGAAVIADGLAGGRYAQVVERLRLRDAHGSVIDWVVRDSKLDWLRQG